MNTPSQTSTSKTEESLDQEAQRRREAGADAARADELPNPGPSEHASEDDD
ncbi:hypothetical protein [Oceanicaulis sp.]|uniref:hypothetical protein n=1 Tax=Oceanicaulis sp. TaxID=1924941 RepID=UPI003BACF847